MNTLLEHFGIIAFLDASGNVFDHVGEVVLNGKVHRFLTVATSAVQLHGFVVLSFGFEVIG